MYCKVYNYSDLLHKRDKSHTQNRFQNVHWRFKRVVATRVTCGENVSQTDEVDCGALIVAYVECFLDSPSIAIGTTSG